jgi:hypothetical protein
LRLASAVYCRLCAMTVLPSPVSQCEVSVQPIHSPRRPIEQGQLLRSGGASSDALKGIPQRGPANPHLFHGEIALEHAAVGAEPFDAGLHVGAPVRRQFSRGHRGREGPEVVGGQP